MTIHINYVNHRSGSHTFWMHISITVASHSFRCHKAKVKLFLRFPFSCDPVTCQIFPHRHGIQSLPDTHCDRVPILNWHLSFFERQRSHTEIAEWNGELVSAIVSEMVSEMMSEMVSEIMSEMMSEWVQ